MTNMEEIYKMNFTKTMFALAIGSVGIMGAMSAHAVAVNNGDTMNITNGAPVYTDFGGGNIFLTGYSGSWFGMDTDGASTIALTEKTALSGDNSPGLVFGQTSTAGPYGFGEALVGSAGPIVDSWAFFGSTGTNFVTTAVTGSTEAGLDFSGWRVAWNNVPSIDMGGGAWGANANGVATFAWDGVYGSTMTLDYTATVPANSPSFPGVKYQLHLEGYMACATENGDCGYLPVTPAIPEASTYAMMLAGLGLVGFMARRRKQVEI
ncbi:MAG: PEP-CTERM sorting domain-containing protein [Thiobacillus sp.]